MTTIMCRCGANDAVIEGRCGPCHTDLIAAERAAQQAMERKRLEARMARRSGRPAWRPATPRGHGHGTERIR